MLFGEIATKFAGMADGAGKTALAMTLFGKAGAGLIPLLNQYGAEQEKVNDEAHRFGLVLSSSTAKVAADAHDNLERLKLPADRRRKECEYPATRGIVRHGGYDRGSVCLPKGHGVLRPGVLVAMMPKRFILATPSGLRSASISAIRASRVATRRPGRCDCKSHMPHAVLHNMNRQAHHSSL